MPATFVLSAKPNKMALSLAAFTISGPGLLPKERRPPGAKVKALERGKLGNVVDCVE